MIDSNEKNKIQAVTDVREDPDFQSITEAEIQEQVDDRMRRIDEEFRAGFDIINKHEKSVTFFGSSRFTEDHLFYKKAQSLAKKIAEAGFDVITGGGPGIMEAGNRGAHTAEDGHSIGFNISLPMEQVPNGYFDESHDFHYFFARKMVMTFSAEAFVYFPGGFGTLDEFFEIVTLVQTEKIPPVPIICVGNEYWNAIDALVKDVLYEKYATISETDRSLYTITEDEDEIIDIITNADVRVEYTTPSDNTV